MFGKGYNHDPSYSGKIEFDNANNPTKIRFLDVFAQANICGGYSNQCRDAFSQDPNT
jgi:hypothetical protein